MEIKFRVEIISSVKPSFSILRQCREKELVRYQDGMLDSWWWSLGGRDGDLRGGIIIFKVGLVSSF